MPRQRHINADPRGRPTRVAHAVADAVRWPLERLVWGFERRFLWRGTDLIRSGGSSLRPVLDTVKWPFERLAWLVEQRVLWPVGDRIAGWGQPGRAAGAGALATLALGAVVVAILSISGGDAQQRQAPPPRVAIASSAAQAPAPAPAPAKPVLQGVAPSFGVAEDESESSATTGTPKSASATPAAGQSEEAAGAAASGAKPVPAGPVAMRTARRFAEAFVFYEVGQRPARARTVFEETATPRLAGALAERPPRLPEKAKVPQARVLNLVAGPRRGKAYTVSVSLLRVGVTSELRLEMRKRDGTWLVTDVRG